MPEKPAPATLSDYDVECDWYLLGTCNYRCSYCFLSVEALGSKLRRVATPEQWNAAFAATKKRWLIHITGGEPTVHPDFVEICALLTRNHVISVNSNLSRPSVRAMAERVDPLRVSFVNAGIHMDERARHSGFDGFFGNARFLQDAGFRVLVTAVATPEVIAKLPALAAECVSAGLQLAPKVLRGGYAGQHYPAAYSPQERRILRQAIAFAREHYASRYAGWPPPSIDVLSDHELLDGIPAFTGRPCSAGFRFVAMDPRGGVYRCGGAIPELGNLLTGSLRLRSEPSPCDRRYCVYFCKKYTADAAHFAREENARSVAVN